MNNQGTRQAPPPLSPAWAAMPVVETAADVIGATFCAPGAPRPAPVGVRCEFGQ